MRNQGTYKSDPSMAAISSNGSWYVWKKPTESFKHFLGRDEAIGNKNHLWLSKDDDNITMFLEFLSFYDSRKLGASGWFMKYFVIKFIAWCPRHLSSCLAKNLMLSYILKTEHPHISLYCDTRITNELTFYTKTDD